jgi:hypothetical protein
MDKPNPGEKDFFTPIEIDGITIWQSRTMVPEQEGEPISIGLQKFLFTSNITISGAKQTVHVL